MFGFVKAQGLPTWPATLVSESGGRLRVTFFGTGKSGLVQKSDWVSYTPEALKKVDTAQNKRRWGAFRAGLKELRAALEGEKDDARNDTNTTHKKKEEKKPKAKPTGLRKQQVENERMFKEIMKRIPGKRQWKCLRCNVYTGLRYKAKTHAVLCSSMMPARRKRGVKHTCFLCPSLTTFIGKKQLRKHDRKEHSDGVSFICVQHKKPLKFQYRQSFLRHTKEQHRSAQLRLFKCEDCCNNFKRKSDLNIHIKKMHPRRQFAKDLVLQLVNKAMLGEKGEMEETEEPNFETQDELRRLTEEADLTLVTVIMLEMEQGEGGVEGELQESRVEGKQKSIVEERSQESIVEELGQESGVKERGSSQVLCEAEVRRQENIRELQLKYNLIFREEIEEKEKNKKAKLDMVERRKRAKASKINAMSEGDEPQRKSPRIRAPETLEVEVHTDNTVEIHNDEAEEIIKEIVKELVEQLEESNNVIIVSGPKVTKIRKCHLKEICSECGAGFQGKHKLNRHVFRLHTVKVPEPECFRTWCEVSCPTVFERDQHSKECWLVCDVCGKIFKREDKFKAHMRQEEVVAKRLAFGL